jgi:hypothetical protein
VSTSDKSITLDSEALAALQVGDKVRDYKGNTAVVCKVYENGCINVRYPRGKHYENASYEPHMCMVMFRKVVDSISARGEA